MRKRVIRLSLFDPVVNDIARVKLENYANFTLEEKGKELAERLADIGYQDVWLRFDSAPYVGPQKGDIDVVERGEGKYAIVANGEVFVILEFGAGVKYGYGHPLADKVTPPMRPGTHPDPHYSKNSKGETVPNWQNDRGWHLPKEKGGYHTYGNPPSKAMYEAGKKLRDDLVKIAREVFGS